METMFLRFGFSPKLFLILDAEYKTIVGARH